MSLILPLAKNYLTATKYIVADLCDYCRRFSKLCKNVANV